MSKLFLKGRRSYAPATEGYGQVLLLQVSACNLTCISSFTCVNQRLYQALVSSEPPSGPPYASSTNFASLPAGPGTARPLHSSQETDGMPSITTFRIPTKDRKFVDQVEYKGWTIKMADWLHLANCDDPSRPIVAHVFRCWVSEEPYVTFVDFIIRYLTPSIVVRRRARQESQLHGIIDRNRCVAHGMKVFTFANRSRRLSTPHKGSSGRTRCSRPVGFISATIRLCH